MGKKRKNSVNNKIFIGLLLILLLFSPLLIQKETTANSLDTFLRLSEREVFGWLDVLPKETEGLHFYGNQSELKDVKTFLVPMYPYDNPFFLVMVDNVYTKDPLYKDYLLPYLKNKKQEIFIYENSWEEVLGKASKKADLLEDPCVFLLIGSPDFSTQVITNGLIHHPFFYWTNDPDNQKNDSQKKMATATGGETYAITDLQSPEKMDITLHAPIKYQRVQFMTNIPYLMQFYTSRITIKSNLRTYDFELKPTLQTIQKIKSAYLILLIIFLCSGFILIFDLLKRSRKKWKKSKKKKEAKNAKKKFCIAWLEAIPKTNHTTRIDKSPLLIGSAGICDYIISEDASVSARHCQIVESKCAFYLFDLQSRNGTFINGQKITHKQLCDQDKIEIGKTVLIFHKSALQYISDEKIL